VKAAVHPSAAQTLAAWVVVLAGVSAALHMAKLMPALPLVQRDLGLSLVQAGFLLSTWQFAGMLLGLVIGVAADRLGAKRSVLTGFSVLFLASALVEHAQTAIFLVALRAMEGFGFLLVVTPAPGLIRRLVPPERLDTMMGIWSSYMPLATALALLGGPFVMHCSSWHAWWWMLALVSLCFALAVWRLVPADPGRKDPPQDSRMMQKAKQTLSLPGPWLVALAFAVYSSQWVAVISFLPTIYAAASVATGEAAALTSLAAAVNIVGNVVAGRWLAGGGRPQRLLYAGYTAMGLAAVLAFADMGTALDAQGAAWVRYAAILVFSMVGGVIPGTLFSLAVRFAPGDDTVSTTVGWMQQWSSIGQFAGPPLVALLASHLGGWQWTWVATASCASLGLLLAKAIARQLARGEGQTA
jgi:MFS family permease